MYTRSLYFRPQWIKFNHCRRWAYSRSIQPYARRNMRGRHTRSVRPSQLPRQPAPEQSLPQRRLPEQRIQEQRLMVQRLLEQRPPQKILATANTKTNYFSTTQLASTMATMSPPNAAVPMWKTNVLPTEETTVNDPTVFLFLSLIHI